MTPPFGPWSTAIGGGAQPRLDTFWRRRMARLAGLRHGGGPTRRDLLRLGAAGLALGTLPTLRAAPAPQPGGAVPAEPGPPGRIYAPIDFPGPDPDRPSEGAIRGIMAVDPETGAWQAVVDEG